MSVGKAAFDSFLDAKKNSAVLPAKNCTDTKIKGGISTDEYTPTSSDIKKPKDYQARCLERVQEIENENKTSSLPDVLEECKDTETSVKNDHLPDGYYFASGKLLYQEESKQKQEVPSPIFVCSKLRVTARTRNDAGEEHGRLLEFEDADGVHHQWAMPMAMLAGEGTYYREQLLSMGLEIGPGRKAKDLLHTYIQSSRPIDKARCTLSTGWNRGCFVLEDETIGDTDKERVILQSSHAGHSTSPVSGSLEEWKENVSKLCIGNSRLVPNLSLIHISEPTRPY